MTAKLSIIFAGTPDFAARHLQALLDAQHQVIAVYSQPDKPAGRGKKMQASPVKQLAEQQQIPVFQPSSLKDPQAQAELSGLNADVMVVVAYGLLLPEAVLQAPKYGCLNVHGSLLPRWRGAAPIQRAIWAGDAQTGVTIMQMDKGLDTGAMLLKKALPIDAEDTSASLYEKLAEIGPQALLDTLVQLDQLSPQVQDNSQASYAVKLSKQEAQLDWQLDAVQLARNVRAFNPWPMAFMPMQTGPVKVWQAEVAALAQAPSLLRPGEILRADKQGILVATADQGLLLKTLQLPGKRPLPCADILNARRDWFKPGTLLP